MLSMKKIPTGYLFLFIKGGLPSDLPSLVFWLLTKMKVDDEQAGLETATDPGIPSTFVEEVASPRKRREPPSSASTSRVRLFLSLYSLDQFS